MASFYSIVYANIRPSVDERVSIALLLRDENRLIFRYAPDKVDVLRVLLPAEAFSLIRTLIKNLNDYIANPEPVDQHYRYRMPIESVEHRFLEQRYVTYLANYSNNILTFSEPKSIDVPVTDAVFTRLFQKYVHQDWEASQRTQHRPSVVEQVRRELYPKVKGRVNVDAVLTTKQVPGLVTPTRVNIVGRNEVNMVAQAIDFNKKQSFLDADVNRMIALVHAFEATGETNGKYFIIGNEPASHLTNQHSVWQTMRRMDEFDFVPGSETDRIDQYITQHDVQPLIPEDVNDTP